MGKKLVKTSTYHCGHNPVLQEVDRDFYLFYKITTSDPHVRHNSSIKTFLVRAWQRNIASPYAFLQAKQDEKTQEADHTTQ